MRLCRFNDRRLGVVKGEKIVDVTEAANILGTHAWPFPKGDLAIARLPELLAAIDEIVAGAAEIDLAGATLLSPVANPTKIIAAPLNYQAHSDELGKDPGLHHNTHQNKFEGYATPIDKLGLFLKSTSSVVGPGEGVTAIFPERRTDHEVELVAIIGEEAANVGEDAALGVVAGYCIGLDMSIRGTEARSMRKSADGYTVLGPWMVTADEVADPQNLDLAISVNGEARQSSNTRLMTVGLAKLISLASKWYRLYPGDVIMTGTPEGVGPVTAGDVMEAEIEGLGSMIVEVR